MNLLWNATGYAISNYTLSAHADTVSGETNTTNNDFTDGIIKVTIVGDVNGDNWVGLRDIHRTTMSFGKRPGNPGYDPNADIDDLHIVDLRDIHIAAMHFGSHE